MEKKGVCQCTRFHCYLSDDLAIFSVDLSDASPLCQEGKDLIELDEKDTERLKLQWHFFYISNPASLFTQRKGTPF